MGRSHRVPEYEGPPELGHNVWFLRMVGNGTRYFTEAKSNIQPNTYLRTLTTRDGWETVGITYTSAYVDDFRYTGGYLRL